ncbi:retinoid-inducible serine carboxypeptidase-like isoform X2 [Frankliniella occidentalis]|uniref:Carboxypeptidase n=1 Tax=Frankliniella occidentalis TaxID=133901 RepID=A0A9C6XRX1_FRAOC|nr:retinoid-inducible serine carboxypeptidase-like isoform X2 [Frankliniella occidentalis]
MDSTRRCGPARTSSTGCTTRGAAPRRRGGRSSCGWRAGPAPPPPRTATLASWGRWTPRGGRATPAGPVATGYSYVDSAAALARTNRQTSLDLVELMRQVLDRLPDLRTVPLYIFGESYGGKVAAEFGLCLYREIANGRLAANLKGVVMGDSWLSGVDHVESWSPYLFHLGLLDSRGKSQLAAAAARARAAAEAGEWRYATSLWSSTWTMMSNLTEGVNIYNFMVPAKADGKKGGKPAVPCGSAELMNGEVRRALGLPSTVLHQNDNSQVFVAQYDEFMKPATEAMEGLLGQTDLDVLVYAGQCDVFTNMAGTMAWLDRLSWPLAEAFRAAPRSPLIVGGEVAGALRRVGRLTALWVHRAGHMVATDYPAAAAAILKLATNSSTPTSGCTGRVSGPRHNSQRACLPSWGPWRIPHTVVP